MPRIIATCPICGKDKVTEKKHFKLGSRRFITLSCGHTFTEKLSLTKEDKIVLKDGKDLYGYQVKGVKFAEESGFNCLIADQTGLGKTIQAVAIMNLHWGELKPFLIVCKGSLVYQWRRHIELGCEKLAQVIDAKNEPLKGIGCYIVSFDMLHKLSSTINKLGIKTIIADEIQMIKNPSAKRTNGLRRVVRGVDEVVEERG
jgi:SNF2 family DNA or RNA helicase